MLVTNNAVKYSHMTLYKKRRTPGLRTCNNLLSIMAVLGALYIGGMPLLPQLTYAYRTKNTDPAPYGTLGDTGTSNPTSDNAGSKSKPIPKDNRIVIPSAFIDEPILAGSHLGVINNGGVWNKKLWTKSPQDLGNTILLGHRFTFKNPKGAFYSLDKVHVGDKLAVYWQGIELIYTVTERKEVPPSAVEVEQNTSDRQLTLYTCTPLMTAKNRLVIIAKPLDVGQQSNQLQQREL